MKHKQNGFQLDSRLEADTFPVARLGLSRLLLMNDVRFPWLILVPEKPGLVELVDLAPGELAQLMDEVRTVCGALRELFQPDKLNVAALGNLVQQLHVHVVARFRTDAAWPRPIWGGPPSPPYPPDQAVKLVNDLRAALRIK
jgi:diadenosine tetraphosphate (Ap4A) HIT family hydrolase